MVLSVRLEKREGIRGEGIWGFINCWGDHWSGG